MIKNPETVISSGLKKAIAVYLVLVGVAAGIIFLSTTFFQGCSNVAKTPEGRALIFMELLESQEATYRTEAALPNLSEKFKKVLRNKKIILTELRTTIVDYNNAIEDGTPLFGFESAINRAFDKLNSMIIADMMEDD